MWVCASRQLAVQPEQMSIKQAFAENLPGVTGSVVNPAVGDIFAYPSLGWLPGARVLAYQMCFCALHLFCQRSFGYIVLTNNSQPSTACHRKFCLFPTQRSLKIQMIIHKLSSPWYLHDSKHCSLYHLRVRRLHVEARKQIHDRLGFLF